MTLSSSTAPLRPQRLADFAGQPQVATELRIVLDAAVDRGELPPHILLSGPPGLGKTTLAGIVATELNLPVRVTSGPALERPGDLVALLVSISTPTVLFVDEIHQMPKVVEETVYSAMEDARVDVVVSEGTARARTLSMPLEPFVLIGATTKVGLLGGPFRDRFGYVGRLKLYDTPTLTRIVVRSAALLDMALTTEAAALIAARSRGTPRIANRLLRRVRDWAQVHGVREVGTADTEAALAAFAIDGRGLDGVDRDLLDALCRQFRGGPVGVGTLAAVIGETATTIEDVHEPYLMQAGLLARTPRGRVATAAAFEHLGLSVPAHLRELPVEVPEASGQPEDAGQLDLRA